MRRYVLHALKIFNDKLLTHTFIIIEGQNLKVSNYVDMKPATNKWLGNMAADECCVSTFVF